jgi:ABC-type polysaccharide/polyol phosphate export permease
MKLNESLIESYKSRKIIFQFIKFDFKKEFLGSYFGVGWAFLQPLLTTLILWFVFEKGFKTVTILNFPFILWLMCGLFPWQFLSNGILNVTNSIIGNTFLVKKVDFKLSLLPLIKIASALFIHIFFVIFFIVLLLFYGYYPSIYWIQLPYYIICSIFLLVGIGWITSSIVIFVRDVSNIISVFLQFGFWLTPIFWNAKTLPSNYQVLLKLNPIYYIVEGYRETFINQRWFWEDSIWTIYFWLFTILLLYSGIKIFRKLRPHFADVL